MRYTVCMSLKFVPLHVHSHYSLLQALPKLPDLMKAAKAVGCTALALTDLGNLYGAIEFIDDCRKHDIKPIIGIELCMPDNARLLLYAENEQGYRNLLKLVTTSYLTEHEGRALLSRKMLRTTLEGQWGHTGLIAVIPCLRGDITAALHSNDRDKAAHLLEEYVSIFGTDSLFIELSMYDEVDGHEVYVETIATFSKTHNIPLVAAQESYYLARDDRPAWETMRKIENASAGEAAELEEDYSFRGSEEMQALFANYPEALQNTLKIAERCTVDLVLGKFVFPIFPLPPEVTADQRLRELCMVGLHERELVGNEAVMERLNYELGIIEFKGYAMYFLVVEDLIRFSRENNIYSNIRGSVAGSMTTYLLQITKIDPLEYKIPFERFLNPERPSAPDIDMDFADDRREEVINYARNTYGADHVAQIGTFGTMLARGVVRDVARALRYPYGLGDRIAKEIPFGSQGFPMTLERALEENPELAKMYKEEEETREIIDLGRKIEGCARHVGVHAAGVVISPKPLVEYAPLQLDPKGGKIITQYDMYSVGEDGVGLTKFDFLGIRNLTILANAVKLIEKIRGVTVDIEDIPMDDHRTFTMLARGETEGTFQLNGAGMTKWLVELRPTTIHDINAMVALYRPGPMQFIPDYIKRKHNSFLISYLDPAIEPILKQTYGVLVYQDDLLMMANQIAGYSWGEVDKFRKAVGKKIPEEMAKQKEKFIKGCMNHSNWSLKKASEVWAWIEPFAAYGFNKAHSASYGRVAYQTAYLKANYPVEYMTAVLTAESGDIETITTMVNECKRMHIPILPPDINESFGDFTVVMSLEKEKNFPSENGLAVGSEDSRGPFGYEQLENLSGENGLAVGSEDSRGPFQKKDFQAAPSAIRFGLYSIKNFGAGIADSIIAERKKNGPFTSLADFLSRVAGQSLNKKGLEALIQSGALDSIAPAANGQTRSDNGRGQMQSAIELLLQYHRDASKDSSQDSLFGSSMGPATLTLPPGEEASMDQRLVWEKELLGLYVSGHPLDKFKDRLAKRNMTLGQLRAQVKPGMVTITGGMIEDVRVILTRKGDQMAFIKIADYDGSIEAVIFPKSYAEHKDIIKAESCIALKGKLNSRNGELSIVAEGLKAL